MNLQQMLTKRDEVRIEFSSVKELVKDLARIVDRCEDISICYLDTGEEWDENTQTYSTIQGTLVLEVVRPLSDEEKLEILAAEVKKTEKAERARLRRQAKKAAELEMEIARLRKLRPDLFKDEVETAS